MSEVIKLSPKLLELNTVSNDIYMTLKMIILTTNVNLNGAKFTEDFIDGVVENQSEYQGIALVVNRFKLENEQYNNLTHEFDGESLNTDMIGSFVAFEKQDNGDGSYSLIGESRIMKRFVKTCESIKELAEDGNLRFSCEVLVAEYGKVEEGFREIPYAQGNNKLIANCVVSDPAEVNAKPTLLVASLQQDLNLDKSVPQTDLDINNDDKNGGGKMALSMAEMRKQMNEHMSKVAKKMRAKMKIQEMMDDAELSAVNDDMVDNMISMMGDDFSSNSWCDFWVSESCVFDAHFVCQEWYSGKLFMFDYAVGEDDTLSISNPRRAKIEYVEVAEKIVEEMSVKLAEIYRENRELKASLEQHETNLSDKNTQIDSLTKANEDLTTEINQLKDDVRVKDETIQLSEQEANEKIIKLGEVVEGLKTQLGDVQPLIEEHNRLKKEKAEKELAEKREALKQVALSSKRITEQEIADNVEIAEAITNLDEAKIKSIIADRVIADEVKTSTELNSTKPQEDVVINTSQPDDLLPQSLRSKYLS